MWLILHIAEITTLLMNSRQSPIVVAVMLYFMAYDKSLSLSLFLSFSSLSLSYRCVSYKGNIIFKGPAVLVMNIMHVIMLIEMITCVFTKESKVFCAG